MNIKTELELTENYKNRVLALQGDKSERLIEVYYLLRGFEFERFDFMKGMRYQHQATEITLELYGAESAQFLTALID